MAYDFAADAARQHLQDKIKERYEPGPMRPRLCEVTARHATTPKLQWMFNAGMGDIGFHDVTKEETAAAKHLLEQGILVRTFEHEHYSSKYRTIKHFDDVNFGLDANGGFVIFELTKWLPEPDMPDLVIRPDKEYDAVINRLKGRIDLPYPHGITVDDDRLQLKGGPLIQPIITDPNRVRIMQRQRGLDV